MSVGRLPRLAILSLPLVAAPPAYLKTLTAR